LFLLDWVTVPDVWPRIAVLGAGAVGSYFGGMLARAGAPVILIGRPRHVEAITRDGLFLDSVHFQEHIPVSASTSERAARDADIVLLCVKTVDTENAAQALALHLSAHAVVISLQNGVDNVERIRAASNIAAIPAVVYVAAAITAPGCIKHSGRGDLVIGSHPAIAAMFARAGIPCRVSENIKTDLWTKMIMNCAYNAISALGRAKYGRVVNNPWTRELMGEVASEAVAIARAAGVQLPDADMNSVVLRLAEAMPEATSSTAQDITRGNRTEIDSLNGYLVRRGAELGIATPFNQTLHALVKLLEESAKAYASVIESTPAQRLTVLSS
jgi:2-dehydropantoate 2-reductase